MACLVQDKASLPCVGFVRECPLQVDYSKAQQGFWIIDQVYSIGIPHSQQKSMSCMRAGRDLLLISLPSHELWEAYGASLWYLEETRMPSEPNPESSLMVAQSYIMSGANKHCQMLSICLHHISDRT